MLKRKEQHISAESATRRKKVSNTIYSAYKNLAEIKYLERHNKVVAEIYLEILNKFKIVRQNGRPYYKYRPTAVVENAHVKIYCDKNILTDITIHYKRPDITVTNKQSKIEFLICLSISKSSNIQSKYNEKINKCFVLKKEKQKFSLKVN